VRLIFIGSFYFQVRLLLIPLGFFTVIDTALFSVVGLYFKLYQLLAFELFFMLVALGLFSRKLQRLHYIVIGVIVSIVYALNTINPVTTLELVAVLFFILAVYFWAKQEDATRMDLYNTWAYFPFNCFIF
jgi:hypothetical protein